MIISYCHFNPYRLHRLNGQSSVIVSAVFLGYYIYIYFTRKDLYCQLGFLWKSFVINENTLSLQRNKNQITATKNTDLIIMDYSGFLSQGLVFNGKELLQFYCCCQWVNKITKLKIINYCLMTSCKCFLFMYSTRFLSFNKCENKLHFYIWNSHVLCLNKKYIIYLA